MHSAAMPEIFASERRRRIAEILRREGKVVAIQLVKELGVSIDTVRRDLGVLAQEGFVQRVHGGALPMSPALGPIQGRIDIGHQAKNIIAEKGAQLVHSGMFVFFDSGSTALQLAQAIPPHQRFTAMTRQLQVAEVLAQSTEAEVLFLGGKIDRRDLSTMSPSMLEEIRRCRFDLLFLGICSIDERAGIGAESMQDVELKRELIACSGAVAGIAAGQKFGTAAPFILTDVSALDYLVTDQIEEATTRFGRLGVTIL